MPSQSQYGSIPVIKEEGVRHDDGESDIERSNRELHAKRASRFLFVLSFLAIVLFGVVTTGTFASDADAKLTLSLGNTKHQKSRLLDRHHDSKEMFFEHQAVDHFDEQNESVFSQRFYKKSKYWRGPGHPILVILGGEDSLDLPMLYPYVHKGLAKAFHAFVLSPEHRFYGESQPVKDPTIEQLIKYMTPDQALLDTLSLIQTVREALGCSMDKTSRDYCPVITFGGSYPGFLSAMLRFRFPDLIDIAYAASAPLELYSQEVDPNAYFDKVSEVADDAVPGCAEAVRSTMFEVKEELLANYTSIEEAAKATGFCHKTFPSYFKEIPEFVSEIITYLIPAVFADFNMAYYPPGPQTALERACKIFEDKKIGATQRISKFYDLRGEVEYGLEKKPECFDLSLELPDGPNARIRGADTSGSGGGFTGEIWEFQCCKDLIIRGAYSEESMFIPRPFDLEWVTHHCNRRFEGVPTEPYRMVNEWKFNDLSNASRILFTNGLKDGWSTSSILHTNNPDLAVINFPNGAHHSDLGNYYPNKNDLDEIVKGHEEAMIILRQWLDEIKQQRVAQ